MIKKLPIAIFILFSSLVSPASALAATLSLSPASGTFNQGCSFSLEIKLDTAGVQTDGTDAILFFDQSKLTANSPISTGSIYTDYPGTNIDQATGKITVSGLASVASSFSGAGTLATVNFTVKSTAQTGATIVRFDFDPNNPTKTTDSNVVKSGDVVDVLSSVTNGNYTLGSAACAQATPTPTSAPGVVVVPGGQGQADDGTVASPSPGVPPIKKELPDAGSEQLTFTIAIVGAILTVLGILGLTLL